MICHTLFCLGEEMGKVKRSDNIIPDYDHLFKDETTKSKEKSKNAIFKKIIRINLKSLILSTLVFFVQSLPMWVVPLLTANIINLVTDCVNTGAGISPEVWREFIVNACIMFVVIVQNIPTTIARWNINSKMVRSTSAGIKSAVVRKLQSLSITYHKDMLTGKVQSKFLKDTDGAEALFNSLIQTLIPNVINVVIAVTVAICKNGFVALFFLVVIPINIFLTMLFRKKIRKSYHDYREKTEGMSIKLSTMLDMIPVTKSHGLEEQEISIINQSIKNLEGSGRSVDKVSGQFGAMTYVINQVLSLVCLVFCSILALNHVIKIGDIVLYQSMFSSISAYVLSLIGVFPQIASGLESVSSIAEIMNSNDVEVSIGKKHVENIEGNVEFEKVCYRYPNSNDFVVKNLSLSVKKGECIAVVGASGSGKSTIMNMIIGFLMPTSGDIKIDGKSITEVNLAEYRHEISVVPQNSILFAGSIRDNITYGLTHYTEDELNKAIELANINEFLLDLPNGIYTNIGEHGDKLSGGQKQRITIARALIRNPKILILDEATSALDNISEYHVQKAISSSIKGRTTFIVAHRLSTIRDADRIVVMEEGRPVEIGTYNELMDKKGKFYELKSLNDMNIKQADSALT